jgi:hypothetical protein
MLGEPLTQLGLVLAGALAAFGPALYLERSRWKRERERTWNELRRQNAVRFLSIISRITYEAVVLSRTTPTESADQRRTLKDLEDDLTEVYEELKLIAPETRLKVARQVINSLNHFVALATDHRSSGDAEYDEARASLRTAKSTLRSQLRNDLNLTRRSDSQA